MDSFKQLSFQFFGNLKSSEEDLKWSGADFGGCWPVVDLSERGPVRKRRWESVAIKKGKRRKKRREGAKPRPMNYIRCLICYTSISGDEKLCTLDTQFQEEGEKDDSFHTLLNLMLKRTEKDIAANGDSEHKLNKEIMKLSRRKARMYLCSSCCTATQHFVQTYHAMKQLEAEVSQMRAKLINAIKLSTLIAANELNPSENIEFGSKRIITVKRGVEFLRKSIIHGSSVEESKVERRRRNRISTGILCDVRELISDMITTVEDMEESSLNSSSANFEKEMPNLKRETGSPTVSPADEDALLNFLPELDLFSADDNFADDDDFCEEDEPPGPGNSYSKCDDESSHIKSEEIPDLALLTGVEEAPVDDKHPSPLNIVRNYKRKCNVRKLTKTTRKRNEYLLAKHAELQKQLENDSELLTKKQLGRLKKKETWAKIKLKYPGITQEIYRVFVLKKHAKEQKCSADGVPGRASQGSENRIFVPVKKVVGENGEVKLVFKNVEIKKLDGGLYCCGICGESRLYKELSYAKTHINLKHIDLSNGFECEYCQKKFYYNNKLMLHLKLAHKIGENYQCEICGEMFATKPGRWSHKRIVHEGIKPHTCKFCGKTFGTMKDMNIHERRHTGDKPFVCHVCAFAFVDKQSMKAHILKRHPEAAAEIPPPANSSRKGRGKGKKRRQPDSDCSTPEIESESISTAS